MRSQDVHDMLCKPKNTTQTPLAVAAWETYLRDHFHARIKSCRTPLYEAAACYEGSCPESTHDMEVRPPTGPVGIPPAGPHMDVAPPNILNTQVAALTAQSAQVAALTAQSARKAGLTAQPTRGAALTARPMGVDLRIDARMGHPLEQAQSSCKGVQGRISQGVESLVGTVRQAAQHMRTRWAGPPGSSAHDLAFPVGRDNPLPEVQFWQRAQPGWVPEPNVFEIPDADKLHAVNCDHITRMNIRASPGFDLFSSPFVKHAVRVVLVEGSRKPQHVNVLAPHLARLFVLMMESASIPAFWKEARLSPETAELIEACEGLCASDRYTNCV